MIAGTIGHAPDVRAGVSEQVRAAVAVETYLHWLQLKLGHVLMDDLMTPDQGIAWHALCRELRLGPAPVDEGVDEATLAGTGRELEAWLDGHVSEDSQGLWLVGAPATGICTLLHDLVVAARPGGAVPVPLLICGQATRTSIALLELVGGWRGMSAEEALTQWWSAVELDIRRQVDRTWRAAPLRDMPALHVIAGVDELGDSAAHATAIAWAGALAGAGARVVVSSRGAEVAGLAALPRLRRLYVLPLTRAPQDRFLAAWARLSGPWGRTDSERVATARSDAGGLRLARRPGHLAMLAVLSARAGDASRPSGPEPALPVDLAGLQRALLEELDLEQQAHRQLLARIVADPASALDEPTRQRWLAVLVAAAVYADHIELGEALGRDPRLVPVGTGLMLAAARAWADGACPIGPVLTASGSLRARPRCDRGHDDEMARLLWLGRAAGWWGPEAIFLLRRAVPGRERLAEVSATEVRPRPLLLALAALDAVWAPHPAALLRAVPLGLVLAEGGTLGPVTAAALHGDGGCAEEVRPIRELFHRFLELELALVALAVDHAGLQDTVMAMVAARDLDLDDALDLALAQDGAAVRPRRRDAGEPDRERGAYLDLALALAARLTPCGAPELVADLERARQVALQLGDELSTPRHRDRMRALVGFLIALLVYAIDHHLLPPRTELGRDEVLRLAQLMGSPTAVASAFAADRQAQVVADWQWVMQQRWAPHRVAAVLLAEMPERVALAPAEILPRAHAWLRAWLASPLP